MAPSVNEIKDLFQSQIDSDIAKIQNGNDIGGLVQLGNLPQLFSNDIKFQIAGDPNEFKLAVQVQGINSLNSFTTASSMPSLASIVDPNKPMMKEIVNVIGGGDSQWVVVVLGTSATSRTGKPWYSLNNTAVFDSH
jgi:hypothetical protein